VVDENASTDRRTWMNLDAGQKAGELRNGACEPAASRLPADVRDTVQHDRMQARITGEDFPGTARGRIPLPNGGNVFAKSREHMNGSLEKPRLRRAKARI